MSQEAVGLRSIEAAAERLAPASDRPHRSGAWALVRSARPKQWAKNILVLAAPAAAGVLGDRTVLLHAALAVISFSLVASGLYLFNDVLDREFDSRHPTKRHRPIAAGVVSMQLASSTGAVLILCGLGLGELLGWRFAVVLVVYVALTTSYIVGLKNVAVIDIAVVASGYIIRAIAGGVAANVPVSQWFLIVASFGSLFLVAGKRHGEHLAVGPARAEARPTLGVYSLAYLRYVWVVSSGVAITAYCLWAFDMGRSHRGFPWYELTIAPFVLAILRYALLLECGEGSAPEDVILGDAPLLVLGVLWAGLFGAAVYLGR